MADEALTLDIPDLQVIIEFPEDEGGMYWHHRVALHRVSPGKWVMLTPDLDLEVVDLNTQAHRMVGRNSAFPRAQAPYVYAFDPISVVEINRQKKLARGYQALLGEAAPDGVARMVWVVCDPRDPFFGRTVPEDLVGNEDIMVEYDYRGIIEWDSALRFIEQVDAARVDEVCREWRSSGSDCRILPVVRDDSGARTKRLRQTVGDFTEEVMDDWPHLGPRATLEFVKSVAESADTWTLYHSEWERNSGIGCGSSLCHEHRTLCDAMRLFCSIDQVNLPNLAGGELLIRRLIQIEMAVERSARAPDFTGLSTVLAGPTTESGAAVTKNFTEWVAGRQRDRAQVLKQERILREERGKEKERLKQDGAAATEGGGAGRGRPGGGRGRGGRGAGRGRDGSTGAAGGGGESR